MNCILLKNEMYNTLRIKRIARKLLSYLNLINFYCRKMLFGFENANIFLKNVDKNSLELILIKNGAKIGSNCDIESGIVFHNCKNYLNLSIGSYCHVGKECFFDLKARIIIGDNCTISMRTTILTHQDLGHSSLSKIYSPKAIDVYIGDNTYIGANATILMGSKIGDNAIVAASSLVKCDVASFSIVAGIPAIEVKKVT